MKKWMTYLLAAALCVTMTGAALAEETTTEDEAIEMAQENYFTGTIVEMNLESGEMLLENAEMGEVLMRFENTLIEGLPTLYPGVTVTFETTGIATMSLPAQMNAVGVECIFVQGAFKGFEDGMMLIESEEMGMIAANLGAGPRVYGLENMVEGAQTTVFFNGMMTRSIPAQIVADVIAFEADETTEEITEETTEETESVEETEAVAEEEASEEADAE